MRNLKINLRLIKWTVVTFKIYQILIYTTKKNKGYISWEKNLQNKI
mgnify:CR=1 FL=1